MSAALNKFVDDWIARHTDQFCHCNPDLDAWAAACVEDAKGIGATRELIENAVGPLDEYIKGKLRAFAERVKAEEAAREEEKRRLNSELDAFYNNLDCESF